MKKTEPRIHVLWIVAAMVALAAVFYLLSWLVVSRSSSSTQPSSATDQSTPESPEPASSPTARPPSAPSALEPAPPPLADNITSDLLEKLPVAIPITDPPKAPPAAPVAPSPLPGDERQTAEKLFADVRAFFDSIDTMEFDFALTDSTTPILNMSGRVSSSAPLSYTFDGLMFGNASKTRIECATGANAVFLENSDNLDLLGQDFPAMFARELAVVFWWGAYFGDEVVASCTGVTPGRTLQLDDGSTLSCTVVETTQSTFFFDPDGRIVRTERPDPAGRTVVAVMDYDPNSMYCQKQTIRFGDGRVLTIEFKNPSFTFKPPADSP